MVATVMVPLILVVTVKVTVTVTVTVAVAVAVTMSVAVAVTARDCHDPANISNYRDDLPNDCGSHVARWFFGLIGNGLKLCAHF